MKTCHVLPLMTMLTCLLGGESIPVERNAALQYWVAFAFLPDKEPDWVTAMRSTRNAVADPAAEQENSSSLRYLHLGAACAGGCFGSRVATESFGPKALLPHLGSARILTRMALARATWRFEHGRSTDALADCVAVLAMSADLSAGSTLIEFMVAISLQDMALTNIARHLPLCQPDERAGLATRLRAPRVRLHRDFAEAEATIWRYVCARPEILAQVATPPLADASEEGLRSIPAELIAAMQAKDPQIEVWSREAEAWLAGSVALIDLSAEEFNAQRARLLDVPHPNPLLRSTVGVSLSVIEMERALAVRAELLVAAAQAFDQAGGLQQLTGLATREGAASVSVNGPITTVQVPRPGKPKPIELIIGRPPQNP